MSNLNDKNIIDLISSNDKRAIHNGIQQLYSRVEESAIYVVSRVFGKEQTRNYIDDIIQETILALIGIIRSQTKVKSLDGLIRKILKNKSIDLLRFLNSTTKNEAKFVKTTDFWNNLTKFRNEQFSKLEEIIEQLNPKCKDIINLYYMQDLSIATVADRLGISKTSAKSRLLRCRNTIKKILFRNNE